MPKQDDMSVGSIEVRHFFTVKTFLKLFLQKTRIWEIKCLSLSIRNKVINLIKIKVMTKVVLKWMSIDGGFEWLEQEVYLDESNYNEIIDTYQSETSGQAAALSDKWERDGNPDPLYLDFDMDHSNGDLVRMVFNYINKF